MVTWDLSAAKLNTHANIIFLGLLHDPQTVYSQGTSPAIAESDRFLTVYLCISIALSYSNGSCRTNLWLLFSWTYSCGFTQCNCFLTSIKF